MSYRDELYDRIAALLDPRDTDPELRDKLTQFVWDEVLTSYRNGFKAAGRGKFSRKEQR